MDEHIFKLIGEAVKGGYALPFVLLFLWEKVQERKERKEVDFKKENGTYVSYQDVENLRAYFSTLHEKFNNHQNMNEESFRNIKNELLMIDAKAERALRHEELSRERMEEHLEKEAKEDIMFAEIRKDVTYNGDRIGRTDDNIEKIFNMITNIKDSMIKMGYGKGDTH